ncbi:hypothetical protein [Sphingomonas sp. LaA6.9]|uniref:hypothetical protein n=1 Tax=Sphingomonas sp. LaA6.9 TaxID=2919914 RepID=UPI001F4FA9A9|nr:hypothetical protein [Sphingomonas sp. LaA6.9]MCJ8156107.1 hypothetical protein [Sphingomonas sp. LaA6.9]
MLRRVIELVDKDVAANSKPISLIGMIIPFVPFMIFVDSAPADSYPVLGGVALAASIGWGLFVMWRLLRQLKTEFLGYRKTLGAMRLWALGVGTVLFILLLAAADIWLSNKIGWPEAYGFDCRGRGCYFQDLAHSPKLLHGGSVYELGLFCLLWLLPACVVVGVIFALFRRRRRNAIEPMD